MLISVLSFIGIQLGDSVSVGLFEGVGVSVALGMKINSVNGPPSVGVTVGVGVYVGLTEIDGVLVGVFDIVGVFVGLTEIDGVLVGLTEIVGVFVGLTEMVGVLLGLGVDVIAGPLQQLLHIFVNVYAEVGY